MIESINLNNNLFLILRLLNRNLLVTIKKILDMHQLSMEGIETLAKEIEQMRKDK
jgi:hypothetical protein